MTSAGRRASRSRTLFVAMGAGVVLLAAAGWAGSSYYAKQRLDERLEAARADRTHPVDVRYDTFSLRPLSLGATLRGLTIANGPPGTSPIVRIGEFSVSGCSPGGGVPRRCHVSARDIQPGNLAADWQAALAQITAVVGRVPRLDLTLDYDIQPDLPHDADVEAALAIEGLGSLTIHANSDGADIRALTAGAPSLELASAVRLRRLVVTYADSGLLPLIVRGIAVQSNSSEALLKERMRQTIDSGLAALVAGPSENQIWQAALTTFIDKPERLEIRLQPTRPMPLSDLISGVQAKGPDALTGWGVGVTLNGTALPLARMQP